MFPDVVRMLPRLTSSGGDGGWRDEHNAVHSLSFCVLCST